MALPLSYNIRNLRVRWKVTLLAVFGVALVVAVFVVLSALAIGFRLVFAATGSIENGIVVQRGSSGEITSAVSREDANVIMVDSRVRRDANGRPMASAEQAIISDMRRRADGQPANVLIRGVTPVAFLVRNGITIVEGRRFTPGLAEVIVGRRIQERIQGLDLDAAIKLQRNEFKVVGAFTAGGSGFESEIWGDLDVMGPAFRRGTGYNSLTVRLADPTALASFDADIRRNPQMQLQMTQERKYYEDQTGLVGTAMWILAVFVSVVMGVGAVFGAMNTMYAIVAARTREIGTLRALGFSRFSILTTFVMESVFLALVGGLLGCLIALPADGITTATGNATFSELAFAFRITPTALAGGLVFAILMGIFGGLLPAFRAARLPIAAALREA